MEEKEFNLADEFITLKEITEDNFQECIDLSVTVEEENYVDKVIYSLAEAWLYGENALPFAIYKSETLIGFVSIYIGENNYQIINFLIDDIFQHKGYGTKAAKKCLEYIRKTYEAKQVSAPVYVENTAALNFWQKIGFVLSDSIEDNYIFMRYTYPT